MISGQRLSRDLASHLKYGMGFGGCTKTSLFKAGPWKDTRPGIHKTFVSLKNLVSQMVAGTRAVRRCCESSFTANVSSERLSGAVSGDWHHRSFHGGHHHTNEGAGAHLEIKYHQNKSLMGANWKMLQKLHSHSGEIALCHTSWCMCCSVHTCRGQLISSEKKIDKRCRN